MTRGRAGFCSSLLLSRRTSHSHRQRCAARARLARGVGAAPLQLRRRPRLRPVPQSPRRLSPRPAACSCRQRRSLDSLRGNRGPAARSRGVGPRHPAPRTRDVRGSGAFVVRSTTSTAGGGVPGAVQRACHAPISAAGLKLAAQSSPLPRGGPEGVGSTGAARRARRRCAPRGRESRARRGRILRR